MRRQQGGNFEYEDESRGMMIDYSDHQPYREGSSTPVLDVDGDIIDEDYMEADRRKYKISEVEGEEDYSPGNSDQYDDYDPQQTYDIQYGSGENLITELDSPAKPNIAINKRKNMIKTLLCQNTLNP